MSLLDDLISHWKLDEASGNALDAHGSNDLTETSGTIDATTGKIGGARDFEAGDTEYFTIADNADLSTGDIDFTIACWVNAESLLAARMIVGKTDGASSWEYGLHLNNNPPNTRFRFFVCSNGNVANFVGINATTFGLPSTGAWIFVVAWHDSPSNTINIQVNNGTVDSAAHSAGVFDGTADFTIGSQAGGANPWDGLIDSVSFWKRVLTSDERTELYNAGAGLDYDDFGGGSAEVSQTQQTSHESLATLQPTSAPPWESLDALDQASAPAWEAAATLLATVESPIESGVGLAPSMQSSHESLTFVTEDLATDHEAAGTLNPSQQSPHESLFSAAQTRQSPTESLLRLELGDTEAWETLVAPVALQTSEHSAGGVLAPSQQSGYESMVPVSQSVDAEHEALVGLLATSLIAWASDGSVLPAPSPYRPRRPSSSPQRLTRPGSPTKRY